MGDFRKKYSADWFREEKSRQRNSWEKQYPALKKISLMTYNAEKKSYTVICRGKKFPTPEVLEKTISSTKSPVPPSPTNVQWSWQPFRGWGRDGFDTLVNLIHQQNGWRAFIIWWFSRLKFCISRYADKRHKWKETVQWNALFLFCRQTKGFRYETVFRRIQPCFYTADRSAWIVLNQPRKRGFWRNFRYILYSMVKEKYVFRGEFLYL